MSNRDYARLVRERLAAVASGVRFGQFVSVGALGAVSDFTVLLTLEGLGVPTELAVLAGIETAILVMFFINEHWTFADAATGDRGSFLTRLKRSHVVRAAGSTTQYVLVLFVYRIVSGYVPVVPDTLGGLGLWVDLTTAVGIAPLLTGLDVWLVLAKGIGIGVAMAVNYVFESLFTWQVHRE